MRISKFLIIGQLPPPVHGSNIMSKLFYDTLRKLGHEVEIIQKTFSKDQVEAGQFSLMKVAKIPLLALKIFQYVRRDKTDICFYFITVVLSAFLVDAIFLFILRFFKLPYVLYCHGSGLKQIGGNNLFLRFIANKTISGAFGAIVLDDRLKEDLDPYLDSSKIYVLPNAIDDDNKAISRDKSKYKDRVQILFLANLKQNKGPLEFLKIAKLVADEVPKVHFVLAGPKKFEKYYQELLYFINQHGLENVIEIPGGIYGQEKREIFMESDLFVLPTQNDAFPLVILEAMRCGLPVISSPIGAIPEMVVDGKNGYIVNPTDIPQLSERTLRLVKDSDLRNHMGFESRKRFEEKFTIEIYQRNLAKIIDLYTCLLEK